MAGIKTTEKKNFPVLPVFRPGGWVASGDDDVILLEKCFTR
jgi:hypothetical protein